MINKNSIIHTQLTKGMNQAFFTHVLMIHSMASASMRLVSTNMIPNSVMNIVILAFSLSLSLSISMLYITFVF